MLLLNTLLELVGRTSDVDVVVKEPGQCMIFKTTLKLGKVNYHAAPYLNEEVFRISAIGGKIVAYVRPLDED